MAKAKVEKFPRFLYKKGGDLKWGSNHYYSKVYVEDQANYDAAIKAGFVDDFSVAIFGESEEEVLKEGPIETEEAIGDDF